METHRARQSGVELRSLAVCLISLQRLLVSPCSVGDQASSFSTNEVGPALLLLTQHTLFYVQLLRNTLHRAPPKYFYQFSFLKLAEPHRTDQISCVTIHSGLKPLVSTSAPGSKLKNPLLKFGTSSLSRSNPFDPASDDVGVIWGFWCTELVSGLLPVTLTLLLLTALLVLVAFRSAAWNSCFIALRITTPISNSSIPHRGEEVVVTHHRKRIICSSYQMDLLLDKVGALSRSIEELYFTTAYWTMLNIYIYSSCSWIPCSKSNRFHESEHD